jgi:arsenical pump membrane protein
MIIWLIALASILLILVRPFGLPEAWWAAGGALLLVFFGLIAPSMAARAVAKGTDVYLFLVGMMIMSELARREGVFDWLARHAVRAAKGSMSRLFVLIYGVGILVTVLLSNDATAVVLTPAVLAAVRTAEAEPLPYLLACAFIANAASFVLPISNPANLVVYNGQMPSLQHWLLTFGLPSIAAIVATFAVLRWLSRKFLGGSLKQNLAAGRLTPAAKLTLWGIALLAVTLLSASALNRDLGLPAFVCGLLVVLIVTFRDREAIADVVREISWSVLPLVAGLFVLVEAVNSTGALSSSVTALKAFEHWPRPRGALASGFGIALLSNLMNNLPSGLLSGAAVRAAHVVGPVRDAILIGVDLGPNLSISGSLATILWLIAIRREGFEIGFWRFLRWGGRCDAARADSGDSGIVGKLGMEKPPSSYPEGPEGVL